MTSSMFLKIEGIEGDAQDSGHKNEIAITHYAWSQAQKGDWGSSGKALAAAMVEMHEISFTFETCNASPKLMEACASGKTFNSATFTVKKAGGQAGNDYFWIKMEKVLVATFATNGASGNKPVDIITLRFDAINFEFQPIKEDKPEGSKARGGYSLKEGKVKS